MFLFCRGHVGRFTFCGLVVVLVCGFACVFRVGILFASVCGLCSAGIAFLVGLVCLFDLLCGWCYCFGRIDL